MAECIHGLEQSSCDVCASPARSGRATDGSMAGKSFALVFAPSLRNDTFLHLNREGDHWKLRWYVSPSKRAIEIAQSGRASTRLDLLLEEVNFVHELAYPYSTSNGGVSITDSRYWFDEIARVNATHGVG